MRTYFTIIRTSAGRIVSEVTKAWSANEFVHRVELAAYDAIKAQSLLDRPAGVEFAKRCSILAKGCAVAAQYTRDFSPGAESPPLSPVRLAGESSGRLEPDKRGTRPMTPHQRLEAAWTAHCAAAGWTKDLYCTTDAKARRAYEAALDASVAADAENLRPLIAAAKEGARDHYAAGIEAAA